MTMTPPKPLNRRGVMRPRFTEDGLIPLNHLWYDSARLVDYVTKALRIPQEQVATELLHEGDPASGRRWYDAAHGKTPYLRCDVVDRMLTTLSLSLYHLGEPDVWCTSPPTLAVARGWTLQTPPSVLSEPLAA
jgi:hypothetical protein